MISFTICEEANLMLTIKQLNKSFGNKQVLYDVN
ncbi:MAG: sodium ABC transporter ATP-binding protein, partial [Lactobacillus iners]|nr:sodium ABC transporter ATP-binding protein [Lactobacillus iners]